MNIIFLIGIILGVTLQQVTRKAYYNRLSGGAYSFSAASAFVALLFFLIVSKGRLEFNRQVLGYAAGFALAYSMACVGTLLAISAGPLSLTSLVISYSLIIPTFYGFAVLGEPIDFFILFGVILLFVSLVLIHFEKNGTEKKITLKWVIYAAVAFVGNGMCSTMQKMQQIKCNGLYKNEFMVIALGVSVIVLTAATLIPERKSLSVYMKKGFVWYISCGIANGVVNYLTLVLSLRMPASIMFPVISAGGIITTALVSIFVYKEKLSLQQYIGLGLGTFAIVVLNI
ncbi:EamA family transporter [Ructibacterium gallinarum]|uniref:EamA family transporter n=1 Tax=Ructibacterium gallinarum TaxID=2779355 RepID=A0A9D5M2I3_9FIRM|nr:EamA family transporter [Ructibacterium gallinarum]MBE5041115.1 EamA family transporter [Ructibacterium gallinarum]